MPLFIVGEPRSGTKLLRDLLNRHPEIAIPRIETEFLIYWANNWHEFGDLSNRATFQKFNERVNKFPFFYYERKAGNLVDEERWFQTCKNFTVQGVFEALIRYDVGIGEAKVKYWGDKSPSYLTQTPVIKSLFPDAKIIHIVRDVRDYCLSNKKAFGKNIYRAAQRWAVEIAQARAAFTLHPADLLELRYEDLLDNPVKELQRVCDFLSIPFQPDMCTLSRPVENKGDARGDTKIVSSNSRKYITEMSNRQLRGIEQIAKPILKAYGYELTTSASYRPLPRWQMSIFKLLDGLNLVRTSMGEHGGIIGAIRFHARYHLITSGRSRNTS